MEGKGFLGSPGTAYNNRNMGKELKIYAVYSFMKFLAASVFLLTIAIQKKVGFHYSLRFPYLFFCTSFCPRPFRVYFLIKPFFTPRYRFSPFTLLFFYPISLFNSWLLLSPLYSSHCQCSSLQRISFPSPLVFLTFQIPLTRLRFARSLQEEIINHYTVSQCMICFNAARAAPTKLFEFGPCSERTPALSSPNLMVGGGHVTVANLSSVSSRSLPECSIRLFACLHPFACPCCLLCFIGLSALLNLLAYF